MPVSIETRWGKFLTLKCFHDFYKDGNCPDLRFVASTDTDYLMRNFRILFRKQEDGFLLLYDKFQTHKLMNSSVLSKSLDKKLVFYIFNDNKLLNHISNIDFEKGESIYYFNNICTSNPIDNIFQLNNAKNFNENKVTLKRKIFSINSPKPILSKDLQITNIHGETISNKSLSALEDKIRTTSHHIDIHYAEEGLYEIKFESDVQKIYSINNSSDLKIWGIIEIFLNSKNNLAKLFDSQNMLSPILKIQFESRVTYWKYLLIGRFTDIQNISDVKINYKSKDIAFSKPIMTDLMTGGKAIMIESIEPIKSSELLFTNDSLSLKVKLDQKWNSKTIAIPKPSIDMVKPNRENGKLYSLAYIYI